MRAGRLDLCRWFDVGYQQGFALPHARPPHLLPSHAGRDWPTLRHSTLDQRSWRLRSLDPIGGFRLVQLPLQFLRPSSEVASSFLSGSLRCKQRPRFSEQFKLWALYAIREIARLLSGWRALAFQGQRGGLAT